MELVVWNSQGNKWDAFWTNQIGALVAANASNVAGFLVEAGWAPWVTPGPVTLNNLYDMDSWARWYDSVQAGKSAACTAIKASRRRGSVWIPWMATPDAFKVNTRCSLGGLWALKTLSVLETRRFVFPRKKAQKVRRPAIRVQFGGTFGVKLTVIIVHLVSGYWITAQNQMDYLVSITGTMVPEGTPALIVGDLNIDLFTHAVAVKAPWSILRTHAATQQSGGELDWGLLYDPEGKLGGSTVVQLQGFGHAAGESDHSAIRYSLPIETN
jgi:hypothetical protein